MKKKKSEKLPGTLKQSSKQKSKKTVSKDIHYGNLTVEEEAAKDNR